MDPAKTLDSLPRLRLCQLPTPIQRLRRLERDLGLEHGPELYIKRDDLTGLAFGGNKGRKLEFSLAEAQVQGADTVFTCGGVQSNHCRQTAVAGRALGFDVHLFLKGNRPDRFTGNLVPSALCGAEFHFIAPDDNRDFGVHMEAFAERLRAQGRRPYLIPVGASNPTGITGYVNAVREIRAQEDELGLAFDWIVVASGSGGTQAGLLAGKRLFGLRAQVIGMAVSPPGSVSDRQDHIARLATETAKRLGSDARIGPEEVIFVPDYAGPAYAVPTDEAAAALRQLASLEGIFLDPVYTAKSMAGLIDYVKLGKLKARERVLFIHTGGNIALFA